MEEKKNEIRGGTAREDTMRVNEKRGDKHSSDRKSGTQSE